MLTIYSGAYAPSLMNRVHYCMTTSRRIHCEWRLLGKSFARNGVGCFTTAEKHVWRHFCLTQCLTFSMCTWGGGAGMLEFLQCWDEPFHWECQEHCWDPGPLGEPLNSSYRVGSTSLLKRGQKILMTVDCAHHTIPDLAFGLKIHLHLQRFCKTLDKLT